MFGVGFIFCGYKIYKHLKKAKTDIIVQMTAATSYIIKILIESTGKTYEPFPVVLFSGWFVEGSGNKKGRLWVLEPKAFRKFLEK